MKANIGNVTSDLIVAIASTINAESSSSEQIYVSILEQACYTLRGLCVFDDYRSEMSCAYENSRYLIKQTGLISSLVQLAGSYPTIPDVATSALLAIKAMITTNEAVQIICQHGINDVLTSILQNYSQLSLSVRLVRGAIAAIRNIAADDIRKDMMVSTGIIEALVSTLAVEPYNQDSTLVEHVFGSFAQLTLRSPGNSMKVVKCGGAVDLIVLMMRKYSDKEALQRQACLTIRNIAGRCPSLRGVLLDAGVEHVLREAGKLSTVVDEAYSALRDLECNVQYVKVTEDGSVVPAFEQFGAAPKLNFRPVYDEVDDLDDRINKEAKAPFPNQKPETAEFHDLDHDHSHEHVHSEHCDH